MSKHLEEVRGYSPNADEAIVAGLEKNLALVLRNADSALVAASDSDELDRIATGFASKRLGLSREDADAGIKKVCEQMKGSRRKGRVAFYYLLAETTGTLDKLR